MQRSDILIGVDLLFILIKECSSQRFLQNFPDWGAKLLAIAKTASTDDVQRRVWSALERIFLRISHMLDLPGVRQEGSALAGKLAGSLTPLLKAEQGEHYISCPASQSLPLNRSLSFCNIFFSECSS